MPITLNTLSFFVHRTRQIYSLPAVALEVLELTNHPRVDCRKLKECIEHDPALVAKILRVVNSSLFGLGREVSDLNQAIALLGIKSLKLLVLGFSLSEAIFRGKTGKAIQHAWRHTLTRAVAARELCEAVWRIPGDEAFTAALLAELGKFVLLDELGEPYAELLAPTTADCDNLSQLEMASLGFDHGELSAELLSHWNLPESLVTAVRLSAKPDQLAVLGPPDNLLPAAVRIGGLVADLVVDGRHQSLRELLQSPINSGKKNRSELDKLRLTEDRLQQLVTRVQDRVGALADALCFELPPGQDYREVLIAAHERLAQLAAEAACAVARQWPIVERHGAEVAGLSTALARYVNRFADESQSTLAPECGPVIERRKDSACIAAAVPTRSETTASAGEDPRLLGRLATVVGLCRQARCSLSLILLELASAPKNLVRQLQAAASEIDHPGAVCVSLEEARWALVIAGCDRRAAVSIGQQLLRNFRAVTEPSSTNPPKLSVGVATVSLPSKNFPPGDLLKAAARCLNAAQLSGGNTLKSIDVY